MARSRSLALLVAVTAAAAAMGLTAAFVQQQRLPTPTPASLGRGRAARATRVFSSSSSTATGTVGSRTVSSSSSASSSASQLSVPVLKQRILQLAAVTDRGKLQDPLISEEGLYAAEKARLVGYIDQLVAKASAGGKMRPELLEGDWELVYTTKQLFRSSPFFQAIARAYNDRDKSELFFKLHELQTCSWGVSQIGRVAQTISLADGQLVSEFDSVIFGLTVIPIIGWFKLLPTFGGRVVSIADGLKATEEEGGRSLRLEYELSKTSFKRVSGLGVLPLVGSWLEENKFPTKEVWKLLPWNWGGDGPRCAVQVIYLDDDFRVVKDEGMDDAIFVYARPLL